MENIISDLTSMLISLGICVALPVSVVYLISKRNIHADNKRAEIILKAIEANKEVDTDKLLESLRKPRKTARETLNSRLMRGCAYSIIGLALVLIGIAIYLLSHIAFSDEPVAFTIITGSISFSIGVSYLIVYKVTRHQVNCE